MTDTGRLLGNTIGATPQERELIEKLRGPHAYLWSHKAAATLESLISDRAKLREALRCAQGVLLNLADEGAISPRAPVLKFIAAALGLGRG